MTNRILLLQTILGAASLSKGPIVKEIKAMASHELASEMKANQARFREDGAKRLAAAIQAA